MGDDLNISGGAGGITAKYDDMLTYAGVLDRAGDGLRTASERLGGLVVSGDFAQAVVLCPIEVAEAEAAIVAAAMGPAGALWVSGELEVSARFLRSSVDAYRFVDDRLANLEEFGHTAAGWALGSTAPAVALLGLAVWGASQNDPRLAAALEALADQAPAQFQETLYDNPWMQEALTRMAPYMVQGAGFSFAGIFGSRGNFELSNATGGRWPTTDYPEAIAGLIALAGLGGAFQDTGDFRVGKTDSRRTLDINADNIISTIFAEQQRLSSDEGQVQVIRVDHGPGEPPSFIVQIPGTQDWSPTRGDNPVDLTTNINLMAMQGDTVMEAQVADAMAAAGIGPGDPVMLTGHSQGGITAAAMASDVSLRDRYNITSVVTGGSPIGRFDIPGDVSVLSLEHDQDVVPKLDGADNPDQPNWVTVHRELSDAEGTVDGQRGPGPAHRTLNYRTTGADVDASDAESIRSWRERNAEYFDGEATATRYQISPEK